MAATVSLVDLHALSDIASVRAALDSAAAEERRLTALVAELASSSAGDRGGDGSTADAGAPDVDGSGGGDDGIEETVSNRVRRVQDSAGELRRLAVDAARLSQELGTTCSQADEATRPVRELDRHHQRAKRALERVDDILDLQACLGGVKAALRDGDFLTAATTVKRFHAVEKLVPVSDADAEIMRSAETQLLSVVTKQFDDAVAANDGATVTRCCQLMNVLGQGAKGMGQYIDFMQRQLQMDGERLIHEAAAKSADDTRGMAVNLLSAVFQAAVHALEQAEPLAAANFQGEDGPSMVLLAVAAVMDRVAGRVVSSFLADVRVKSAFQARPDYLDAEYGTVDLESDVVGRPNVYDLDALLDEMALVSQRCVSFLRLVQGKAKYLDDTRAANARAGAASARSADSAGAGAGARASGAAGGDSAGAAADDARSDTSAAAAVASESTTRRLARHSNLLQYVAELAGVFSQLEEAFMVYSTKKAVALDEVMDDSGTSSVVEDAFYVLQKAGRRAMATGESDCACSVVNHMCAVLTRTLYPELDVRVGQIGKNKEQALSAEQLERYDRLLEAVTLNSSWVRAEGGDGGGAAALSLSMASLTSPGAPLPGDASEGVGASGAGGADGNSAVDGGRGHEASMAPDNGLWCVSLNNVEAAMDNLASLHAQLAEQATLVFTDEMDRVKLQSCIAELDAVRADLKKRMQTGLTKLCASLSPRLRSALGVLEGASAIVKYELTEAEFTANESFNAFSQEFIAVLHNILAPYQHALSDNLFRAMLFKIASYIAKQLESAASRKAFNGLGGMQFDRDVRAVVTLFVSLGPRTLRDRFVRLTQVAQVLSSQTVEELQEEWNVGATVGTWQVSGEDAKKLLGQRTDLAPESIAGLRLS